MISPALIAETDCKVHRPDWGEYTDFDTRRYSIPAEFCGCFAPAGPDDTTRTYINSCGHPLDLIMTRYLPAHDNDIGESLTSNSITVADQECVAIELSPSVVHHIIVSACEPRFSKDE